MKKIKIAQIGAGHDHAAAAITTLKLQSDIYDLVGYAVVEGDEQVYESNQWAYENVREMTVDEILNYPGLDAVCIETEDRRLTEYAVKAAEKGFHIHMDKPGSVSDEDFDRLIDLVKKKNLVFHTGYMYRYNPAVIQLKEDIQAGKLGEIYAVKAQMNCNHPASKRQWLGSYPGGMLYFLGCHLIDLIYSICGQPEEIIPLSMPSGIDGVTAEDIGMVVMRYENGLSFAKTTALEIGGYERRYLTVCGTKGTVELKPLEWEPENIPDMFSAQTTQVKEAYVQNGHEDWHKRRESHWMPLFGRYDSMLRAFASYVRGETKNPYTYEYERGLHKLILKSCGVKNVQGYKVEA